MRRLMTWVMLLTCASWCTPLVWAGSDEAQLVSVVPARLGNQIVCRLQTSGLPGAKQLQSMRSGLVSAVDLNLVVLDENDQPVAGHQVSLRLAFDLWDEVFSVRSDDSQRRFHTLADLQTYLADLTNLPVAAGADLDSLARYRLQVGLVAWAVAPDEQQRVADVIAGEPRRYREGQDQQETSVSLGRLIGFFYKSEDSSKGRQLASAWFTRRELPDATH